MPPELPTITTLAWVPAFARGFVRDLRPRWAFEEVGQPYEVILITDTKCAGHRHLQPFGQVPTYRDHEVSIFESGAIVLRIAERAGKLIPRDAGLRMQALQWLTAALNSVEPFVMALAINDVFEADREWSRSRHDKVVEDLTARLADLEAVLGDKEWLDGVAFTVGDLMMISVLGGLRGTGVLGGFPRLQAYVARGRGPAAPPEGDGRSPCGLRRSECRAGLGPPRAGAVFRVGGGADDDANQDRNMPLVRPRPGPRGGRVLCERVPR